MTPGHILQTVSLVLSWPFLLALAWALGRWHIRGIVKADMDRSISAEEEKRLLATQAGITYLKGLEVGTLDKEQLGKRVGVFTAVPTALGAIWKMFLADIPVPSIGGPLLLALVTNLAVAYVVIIGVSFSEVFWQNRLPVSSFRSRQFFYMYMLPALYGAVNYVFWGLSILAFAIISVSAMMHFR